MKKNLTIQGQDFALAFFVLSITAMLVMPLPTSLLDFLLVINISFSLLLLLAGLYMPNALALLSFPSLLLLTTLFRLGLNVASTRLILSQGNAGHVIEAFGTFLVRGEVAIGVIIFLIITIVNFIVIARGSSRVSEVAARFALDSLPGKQMAIDSDLRAGLVDPMEARKRRDDLRKESQLYGAMDGAMRFIQGDAIAGFFIIITNIVGGMYLGIKSGMSVSEAIETYTILTVGDGLVSQIPSLLISICAGIVVTRVSSGENITLGKELAVQLFKSPSIVALTGAVLIFFAILPGLPAIPFFVVGVSCLMLSFYINKKKKKKADVDFLPISALKANKELLDDDSSSNGDYLFQIFIDRNFGNYINENSLKILNKTELYKKSFFNMTGFNFPSFKFTVKKEVENDSFFIYKEGVKILGSSFSNESLFVDIEKSMLPILGISVLKDDMHPIWGNKVYSVKKTPYIYSLKDEVNLKTYDKVDWIFLQLVSFCINNPNEFIGISNIIELLKNMDKDYPELVRDLLKIPQVSTAKIFEVYLELIREEVFYLKHKTILENIVSYFNSYNVSADSDFDVYNIVSFIRQNKKIHITSDLIEGDNRIKLCSLSDELQNVFEEMIPQLYEGDVNLDMQDFDTIKNNMLNMMKPFVERGITSFSIVTPKDLLAVVASILKKLKIKISVISFEELNSNLKIEHIGTWRK